MIDPDHARVRRGAIEYTITPNSIDYMLSAL